MWRPSLRLLLLVFILNASANLSATSTLNDEVEYDDNIDVEELKKLAKEKCSKNPDYKLPIWKCLRKPVFDNDCISIAQVCTKIDTDFTDTNADQVNVNLASVVENVVSGLEDYEGNDIKIFSRVEFSYQESHPEFREEILAKCLRQGVEEQWIMKGTQESSDEFCNNVSISPASYLTELQYQGKCKPSWLSLDLRAAFYMECLERFDFDGLVSRVQSDVRSMDEIAIAYRKAELKSAETSVGVGASYISGGILAGVGLMLSPFTAGGSLFLTGIGSAIVGGSSIASLVDLFSDNDERLIIDAAERAKDIKKDVGFLEELMTIYIARTNEALPALTFNQQMMRKDLENKVKAQVRSSTLLTLSTAMIVDTIINAVKLKNVEKAVQKNAVQNKLTRARTMTTRLYQKLTSNLASRLPLLTRIASSQFGLRAAKFFKATKTGIKVVFKAAIPFTEIGFGIWEILLGKEKMAPGGIHNQILLQSRQIIHRIADLAAAYTEVVGTPIDVNVNKFVSEQLYEIDVYSQTKGVSISLEIESGGNKCQTKKFKTGSQGHVFIYSSDLLDQCDKHQIENKTATIRLISYSSSRVQIDKVDIRTNGKFVPSISCTKKDANTSVPLILTRRGISDPIDCKREMALQRVKTHTTHILNSGTDANLDMTFRVTNSTNDDVRRCEKLRLNDRCSSYNCHEYGDIDNYYVSDLATCDDLMEELAEGLWDSEEYELEVEMYNDGSGIAPEWSTDMLKLYFVAESEAKIVSCYGGPDQGDAGDVWIKAGTTTILKCQLHQPNKPEISLEATNVHVCDLTHSGSGTDKLIFRFCEKKDDLEGSPAEVRNNPQCCVTNRFGYYNMNKTMTQLSTSSYSPYFERNKWKMIDGNTKYDDGGDKLGQCEGFEIKGPKIFMSVENQHSDAVCIDQLEFYGTPKLAIEGTPFATCRLPAHTWA